MNNQKTRYGLVCFIMLILMPVLTSANMVWPSVYIAEGLRSWYVILMGLMIETAFVKCFLRQTVIKSFLITFVMNLASTVIGVVLVPASGFFGEILMIPFDTPTFHLSHWILSYILAILSNVIIEGLTVKYIFKFSLRKMFWWLFAANAISIIICILFHGFTMGNIIK